MIIGTVRPEEARVFDSKAGPHRRRGKGRDHGFEVFWADGGVIEDGIAEGYEIERPGWYWMNVFANGTPDGEYHGPFARSSQAYYDATPNRDEIIQITPNTDNAGLDKIIAEQAAYYGKK